MAVAALAGNIRRPWWGLTLGVALGYVHTFLMPPPPSSQARRCSTVRRTSPSSSSSISSANLHLQSTEILRLKVQPWPSIRVAHRARSDAAMAPGVFCEGSIGMELSMLSLIELQGQLKEQGSYCAHVGCLMTLKFSRQPLQ